LVAVIQRCSRSSVTTNNKIIARIDRGILVLIGICRGDKLEDADYIANKISLLRIFNDKNDKMNLSIKDINGSILIVSQFTLCGNIKKGSRPSFLNAASPEIGYELYKHTILYLRKKGIDVHTGKFGAMMDIELINEGPATFIIDSKV